jgi:hypothetical protein
MVGVEVVYADCFTHRVKLREKSFDKYFFRIKLYAFSLGTSYKLAPAERKGYKNLLQKKEQEKSQGTMALAFY